MPNSYLAPAAEEEEPEDPAPVADWEPDAPLPLPLAAEEILLEAAEAAEEMSEEAAEMADEMEEAAEDAPDEPLELSVAVEVSVAVVVSVEVCARTGGGVQCRVAQNQRQRATFYLLNSDHSPWLFARARAATSAKRYLVENCIFKRGAKATMCLVDDFYSRGGW